MATQLQLRRGTTTENNNFTGAEAELTYDSTSKGLRIHDGSKQGGYMVDTLVAFQAPTASNNYTWYRKYASGWVEQGCLACYLPAQEANTVASAGFNFPIAMLSTAYDVNCLRITDGGNSQELTQIDVYRTTSGCSVGFVSTVKTNGQSQLTITVRGMAA